MSNIGMPNKAFSSKIDPDEPWRYRCPACRRQAYLRKRNQSVTCEEHGVIDRVYDKKLGFIVPTFEVKP